jgi:tetratricopeptide (TPR) repeat protein
LRKELLAAGRKVLGKDHPQTLEAAVKLSSLFINEDKRTEAQALNQELAALTLEDSKAGSALTEILSRMGRWDEAAANCSLLINANPDDVMAWFKRGEIFGRTGRWKEAAADLAHAVRLKPTDNFASRILAPVLIANRDLKSYRQLCQHMLTQFADTKDIGTADTVAKNCLLLPSTEVDSNAVAKLADVAVMLGSQSEYFPWFELCKGLAEYRQEHFDGAAEWSQKALTKQSQPLERDACAYLVLAMAQMKAGRHSAARVAFRTGAEIVEKKLPNLNSDDLGVQWVDVIIANILMREAKALIEGQPATATEKKTESP